MRHSLSVPFLVLSFMTPSSLPVQAQSPLSDGLILGSGVVQDPDFGSDRYTTKKSEPEPISVPEKPRLDQGPKEAGRKVQVERRVPENESVAPVTPGPNDEVKASVATKNEVSDQDSDPRDTRRNTIEVGLGLGYLYNDSQSSSWFRRYHSSGGIVKLESRLWLSNAFGIQGTYTTSFGHSISAHPPGRNAVAADHQTMELGVRYRQFFGSKIKSPSLTLGLDHREYRFGVASGQQQRTNLSTAGVRIMAELQVPDSLRSRWDLGIEVVPRATHREMKSQTEIKSGSKNQTDVLGIWLGETYTLNRSNQVYWRLSHVLERTLFSGTSSPVDPVSSAGHQGVAVSNSLTMLTIGYFWGE